jgi:hypothetical protein
MPDGGPGGQQACRIIAFVMLWKILEAVARQ